MPDRGSSCMRRIFKILASSLMAGLWITATAGSDSAVLSWSPPTTNTDGSPLTDLIGFNVYHGTNPTAMMLAATVTATAHTFAESNLTPSVWYWHIRAVNALGVESEPSATVSKTIVAAVPDPVPPPASQPPPPSPVASTPGTAGSFDASGSSADPGGNTAPEAHPRRGERQSMVGRRTLCRPYGTAWCSRM